MKHREMVKQGKIFLPMACEGGQVAVKRLTLIICGGGGFRGDLYAEQWNVGGNFIG